MRATAWSDRRQSRTRCPPFHSGRNTGPSLIAAAASQARKCSSGLIRRPSGTATTAPSAVWSVLDRRMLTRTPCSPHPRSEDRAPPTRSGALPAPSRRRAAPGRATPPTRRLRWSGAGRTKTRVGGRLALGWRVAGAADASDYLGDDLATGGAVRGGVTGALVRMSNAGERAAHRRRGFSRCGEGREVDRHEGRRSGQGRGAAVVAPAREAGPVAIVGAA